ncbi:hypothetical protein BACCELL_03664 [Bacteroides cellulosilyticus DSM 14838]|uniref:Uncharacterized protein n=1 Tax=Bacteroides cellulosilyticus DSM 14838 TaxID=537012 RepID=E2NH88_9BACE|nr:hypothetical protein BACCELL_03664 [Bacteroides cellulosilyticus DSM 14838]
MNNSFIPRNQQFHCLKPGVSCLETTSFTPGNKLFPQRELKCR